MQHEQEGDEGSFLSFIVDREHGWATLRKGERLWEQRCLWTPQRSQAAGLVPFLKELFDEAREDPRCLRGLAAPCGPTSFTTLRLTLTVARIWAFAVPEATLFSPTQFHVLAFAVREQVPPQTDVLVLLDSFKQGVYGSTIRFSSHGWPQQLGVGEFYDVDQLESLLAQNGALPWVTNCTEASSVEPYLKALPSPPLKPRGSLATAQLRLWDVWRAFSEEVEDQRDMTHFQPFYGHTPHYVKVHKHGDRP